MIDDGVRAILFDCYGTLISTGNGSITAVQKILKVNQAVLDEREFYSLWKRQMREECMSRTFRSEAECFAASLEKLYIRYNFDRDARTDVQYMLDTLGNRHRFEEAADVLNQLRERYMLVVASNSDELPLREDLKRSKLPIERMFSSEQLRAYKPDRRFFEQVLTSIGLSPEEAVYVGDSQTDDVLGAQGAELRCVWINRLQESLVPGIPEPFRELSDLTGLLDFC
ncbi:HAD family hydrolase [Paenibacillus senegalensis]|uniref:HAD family hydrolase n=1 Tax=Paenibacillus senegalensis TaxID=1465766 RepID=UPI000288AF28|nr:HAD family hydrolase [Paenibacillus senegalensis]